MIAFHDSGWLQQQRSRFVYSWSNLHTVARNSVLAGNTGTRAEGGRPMPKWKEGCDVAQQLIDCTRSDARSGAPGSTGLLRQVWDAARVYIYLHVD